MSAILFGVPGKLKELLTRVPANNASKIANLNATITSRAPAGTAVSNAVLTPARSALLDNLDAAITTLTSGTTDTSRHDEIITDLEGVVYGLSTRQSELNAATRYNAMILRTGIKNIFYVSAAGYGPGTKTSAGFDGSYTVVRDHTFIVPLCFGGIYGYNWYLANNLKTVSFSPTGGTTGTYHTGRCIVIEFNG